MIERARKKKKQLCISEDDIATVLQRYSATTVLALLKEVSRFPDVKLDWKELVKNTETGISNAREYQMLWRHLAYRQSLLDKLEDGAEPLDEDSDLEYELAPFPPVSHEASSEATACVKVMMESGSSDSGNPGCSMVEAPLTINIPNGHSSKAPFENSKTPCSMQGINITVPVSVQKQPLPAVTSTEGLDANGTGGGNFPPRRKRKPWTEAEDVELIAAVQKCGEGNWANILKGDFKGDRTASQLSQRWAIIRKKNGNINVGGGNPSSGTQLSEAQLAARNAMNLALNPPAKNISSPSSVGPAGMGVNVTSSNTVRPPNAEAGSSAVQAVHQSQQAGTGLNVSSSNSVRPPKAEASSLVHAVHQSEQVGTGSNTISSNSVRPPNAEASSFVQATHQSQQVASGLNATSNSSVHPSNAEAGTVVQGTHQSQQGPIPSKSMGPLGLSPKSRTIAKKPTAKSVYNSDSMVKATAVAAGARIATQSVADSVIKAAKNVHIMPTGGGSLMKSSMSSGAATHLAGHPNVHYICTGLAASAHPTYPPVTTSVPRSGPTRTAVPPTIQRTSSTSATLPNMPSKQTIAIVSSLIAGPSSHKDVKTAEGTKLPEMDNAPKEQVQEKGTCAVGNGPSNQVEDKTALSNQAAGLKEETTVEDSLSFNAAETDEGAAVHKKAEESQDANQNNNKKAEAGQQDENQNCKMAKVSEDANQIKALSEDANQNSDKAEVSEVVNKDGNQRNDNAVTSQDENQRNDDAVMSENENQRNDDAVMSGNENQRNDIAVMSRDENQNNSKAEVSRDENQSNSKAEASRNENQNNSKAEVSQDENQNSNKAEVSQDASQNNNKGGVSEDENQKKNKAEESQHANQQNNKAPEIQNANEKSNKTEERQEANQSNVKGEGEPACESSKNQKPTSVTMPSVAADEVSEKQEVVNKAVVGSEVV